MTAPLSRPPDPAYYRRFVAGWCAVLLPCRFVIVAGESHPKKTGPDEVTVGGAWLKRQAIPETALRDERTGT